MADGRIIIDTDINTSGAEKGVKNLDGIVSSGLNGIAKAATIATAAAAGLGGASIKVGSDFQSSMSQVAATMGMTSEEIRNGSETFDRLTQAAKDAGAKTKFSATQAGEALNYLALAGYDADKSIAALPVVLDLAAAGGLDLGYASDMVTDSMSALGIETSQLKGFVDQLAKTSQKSNTDIGQLGEGILTVGGTAKVLAGNTVELNTVLGILADNGIKGAEGGTVLRNVILSLSAPTDTAAEAMRGLGLNAFDANGNLRPMNDIFNDLNSILGDMTQGEQTEVLNKIFNKTDLKGVNALLANSGERFDELSGYISDCDNAASDMAITMDDNLKGKMTILGSSLEGLGIQIYEKMQTPLENAVDTSIKSFDALSQSIANGDLNNGIDKIAEGFANIISVILELIGEILPKLIEGLGWILDHGTEIAIIIGGIATAMAGLKVGAEIMKVVKAWQEAKLALGLYQISAEGATITQGVMNGVFTIWETLVALITGKTTLAAVATGLWTKAVAALNAMWAANPIGIVIVAIVALVAAFVYLWNTSEGFRNFFINMWEGIKTGFILAWNAIIGFFTETIPAWIESIKAWFSSLSEWFGTLWEGIKQWFVDGWNSIVTFFTESIPMWWEGVKQAFADGWNAVVAFFTETIPMWLEQMFNWFCELPDKIAYGLGFAAVAIYNWTVESIKTFIQCCENIIYNVGEWFKQLPGVIWTWLVNAYNNIVQWASDTWNKFKETCSNVYNSVTEWFSKLPGMIWNWLKEAINKAVQWGQETYWKMVEAVANAVNAVIEWFAKLPGRIWEWLVNTVNKVIDWASNLGSEASKAGGYMVECIIDAVKDLPSKFLQLGIDIVKGIWEGIKSVGSWLNEKVSGFFENMLQGAKDANEIKSPSRLYRDQVGKYMAQGVGVGFEDEADNVQKSIENDLKKMAGKMQMAVDYNIGKTTASIVAGKGYRNPQTNIITNDKGVTQHVTIVNPERTPSENARALKKAGRDLAFGN